VYMRWFRCALGGYKVTEVCAWGISVAKLCPRWAHGVWSMPGGNTKWTKIA
jgi:hypothetical protein